MGIQRDTPRKLPRWKKVPGQVDAGYIAVMGHFGKQINNAFAIATVPHQIIQYKNSWTVIEWKHTGNIFGNTINKCYL